MHVPPCVYRYIRDVAKQDNDMGSKKKNAIKYKQDLGDSYSCREKNRQPRMV